MRLVVRFFNITTFSIREEFLGFFDCFKEASEIFDEADGLSGKVLGTIVLKSLEKLNLTLFNLTSVTTDTCNVMASVKK